MNFETSSRPDLSFLVCKECGGSLLAEGPELACECCHGRVADYGGIVDFVAGAASTALDDIDYDQFYSISSDSSLDLYHNLRDSAGALWPATFGDVLELGSGTGGFSMALLENADPRHAVLTDVSVKMLQICRTRLEATPGVRHEAVGYVTYSGTEGCFRADAFDTCCGTSVVHHIADVPRLMAQVYRLLRPGGRAFFLEPNARFHQALTRTVADIVAAWLSDGTVSGLDISLMLNWTGEVHCNIINSGDIEILAEREDKHQFVAESFEAMARAAGFERATALPARIDPTGAVAVEVYLAQCGVSAGTMALLREVWPAAAAVHFAELAPRDQAPSYLLWMEKGFQGPSMWDAPPGPIDLGEAVPADGTALHRLWLGLTLRRHGADLELVVDGWCVSHEAVRAIEIDLCGVRRRLPIWRPRPDVHQATNQDGIYPPLHTLCSGIAGSVEVHDIPAAGNVAEVGIRVLTVRGATFPPHRVVLDSDGDRVVFAYEA